MTDLVDQPGQDKQARPRDERQKNTAQVGAVPGQEISEPRTTTMCDAITQRDQMGRGFDIGKDSFPSGVSEDDGICTASSNRPLAIYLYSSRPASPRSQAINWPRPR